MKFVLVTHVLSEVDGQGKVNLYLARYLLDRGHTVHAIARSVERQLYDYPLFSATLLSIPARPYVVEAPLFMAFGARAVRHARAGALVINNGSAVLSTADVNYCHMCHSSQRTVDGIRSGQEGVARRIYQALCSAANALLEQYVYHRRSIVIVAVSQRIRTQLIHDARVDPRKIAVICNGVDTTRFYPAATAAEKDALRQTLGLPGGPLLLFVGDLRSWRKGLDTVLRALTLSATARLLVVGDSNTSPFPELARALGLAERVSFLGFRHDVPDLMRAADLFVFPSRNEPWGLVVLEAMASGLPVITTGVAGSSEAIIPGANGMVLESPDDHVGLAHQIDMLLSDVERRRAMGSAARSTALGYDWDVMMARAEELLLSRGPG